MNDDMKEVLCQNCIMRYRKVQKKVIDDFLHIISKDTISTEVIKYLLTTLTNRIETAYRKENET